MKAALPLLALGVLAACAPAAKPNLVVPAPVARPAPARPAAPPPPTAPTRVLLPLSTRLSERAVPSDMSVPSTVMPTPVSVVFAPRVTGPV